MKIGECLWEIEPQVLLDAQYGVNVQSRADFVLWPVRTSGGQKPVEIYTDGFLYHKDKVADDTLKREQFLREQGYSYTIAYEDTLIEVWEEAITLFGEDTEFSAGFFSEEWSKVVNAQEAYSLELYLKTSRLGRGTRLDRKKRIQVWHVFVEYQNMSETAWPAVQYLWPLHPIFDWVNDKAGLLFGRSEAPLIGIPKSISTSEYSNSLSYSH